MHKKTPKVVYLLTLLSFSLISISLYLMYEENKEEIVVNDKISTLQKDAIKIEDEITEKISENIEDSETEETTFNVDWEYLKQINPDIIGWIYIPNTHISYPILYSGDNDYYLRRMYDKTSSVYGSIFLEGNNTGISTEMNTIIYGHNTLNKTMFADLNQFSKQSFFDNNPYIYIYTPERVYQATIITTYIVDDTSGIYHTKNTPQKYIKTISNKNKILELKRDVMIEDDSKLITLSTCSFINGISDDPKERLLVHAVINQ